ncbi:hypothetical protein D3C76_751440 [compost metagenome]
MAFEQAGTGAIGAGVEFYAEQADGVETDADQTFGKARLIAQQQALGPFLLFRLGCVGLTIIPVEVKVAQFQAGFAVCEEACVDLGGQAAAGQEQDDEGGFHCLSLVIRRSVVMSKPIPH